MASSRARCWTSSRSGCCATAEHAGLDLDSPLGRAAYDGMGRGRPHVLDRLAAVTAGEAV